ncbi:MAG TPA: Fic family protein [Candidatus Polarisedimenticolia bacterium]|nr:Fic family protein [Candidatus Polarisedimenticolia bacterium]
MFSNACHAASGINGNPFYQSRNYLGSLCGIKPIHISILPQRTLTVKIIVKYFIDFFTAIGYKLPMDKNEFILEKMTGKLLPLPKAPADAAFAFVPNPLPPNWEWPHDLWPLLSEAHRRLAGLDGTGKHLPNPEILLQPLQSREAQLSSQLEGTFTDPQQQVLFQADPRYPTSKNDPNNAFREVWNYRRALRLRLDEKNSLPLSLRLIKQLHAVLLEGVRGSDQTPGEFRTIQNQIGFPARFVPPPPEHLSAALDEFEKFMHSSSGYDPLVRAFLAHYQFESIHPFRDGNGRVGRLLLSWMIAEWCGLSNQWLYMSAFFERRRKEYMDLMLSVSTQGTWDAWIRFCLQGVVEQSIDAEKRCDKLLKLHRDFHQRLKGGTVRLSKMVDRLFSTPVITVKQYKKAFEVSYPTARLDLKKLEAAGIVKPLEPMNEITYYCYPIYQITFADLTETENVTAQ